MKRKIVALVGLLVLSLTASVALAGKTDPADKYENSDFGTVTSGVIKSLRNCPDGTDAFFKNVNPFISGGPGGNPGELRWDGTFPIDGTDVTLTVFWRDDNSFRYEVTSGVMYEIGAEVDNDKLIYKYPGPVSSDAGLNVRQDGSPSADVNHLDICLSVADPGDIIDPVVTIEEPTVGDVVFGDVTVVTIATDNEAVSSVTASIDGTAVQDTCQLNMMTGKYECTLDTTGLNGGYTITVSATDTSGNTGTASVNVFVDNLAPVVTITSPSNGDEVSGTVTVNATVTDDYLVPGSVTASVYPVGDPSSAEDLGAGSPAGGDVFTWSWDTAPLLAGPYTIEVSADDTSGNTGTDSVTVDVLKLLTDCFGLLDAEDFPGGPDVDPYPNGCKPTPLLNVQAPPYTEICNPDLATGPIPAFCYLSGELLLPDPNKYANAAAAYGGCDACEAGYCGDYGLPDPRMECTNGDIVNGACTGEWQPKTPLQPLFVADVAVGTPDLVLGKFVYGYEGCFAAAQHTRGGASIVDLYPFWPVDDGSTPNINEATGAVFVKTDFPADVIPPGLIAQCDAGLLSAQSGYQPIGKFQSLDTLDDGVTPAITLAATENCVNPPRKATRDNGYDVTNIIETDGSNDLLAFKYERAQAQFDGVFAALDCARPTLLTGKFSDVSSPVNQAKAQFDNGTTQALQRAIVDLDAAAFAIREETTWQMTPENCAGDALARIYNLSWRIFTLLEELTQ